MILDRSGRPVSSGQLASVDHYLGANMASPNRSAIPYGNRDSTLTMTRQVRINLLSAARWLYQNVGFVKGAVRDVARYSVGGGLRPQSQIPNRSVAQQYEDFWREWAKIPEPTGRWNYAEMLRLQSMAVDVDGDVGRVYLKSGSGWPQLSLVPAHRIGVADNGSPPMPGLPPELAGYRDGVLVDGIGRPTSYRVSMDAYGTSWQDYDARNFALVLDPDRVDEYRGKTAFHAAINTLQDSLEILSAELVGVKGNSALIAAITTAAGFGANEPSFGPTTGTAQSAGLSLEQLQMGTIPRLGVGESITAHTSNRPSPTFTGFLEHIARDVAVGYGVPYDFVWRPDLSGSGNRLAIRKAGRKFEERRDLLTKHATRDWGYVVSCAVKRGDIPFHPDWWRVNWQGPASVTVDAGREAQQDREDLKYGIRTHATDAAERGADWQEERDQVESETRDLIERAQRLAKETGADFGICLTLLQQRNANGSPISATQAAAGGQQQQNPQQ